jgi:hypothetical protein
VGFGLFESTDRIRRLLTSSQATRFDNTSLTNLHSLNLQGNPLSCFAHCSTIPGIEDRNPGIALFHDPMPAECGCSSSFLRGDSTGNAQLELTDAVRILRFLFLGNETPTCLVAFDSNADNTVELTDAVAILGFLFLGNPPTLPGMGECETVAPGSVLSCKESQPCGP